MSENIDDLCLSWEDGKEIPNFEAERSNIMEFIKKYPQCFTYSVHTESWIYHKANK